MVGYSLGAAGSAGFGTVPGLLLAIYLTNALGVAAGLASLVVLIPKLWDVIFLPFVGSLSDRFVARHGHLLVQSARLQRCLGDRRRDLDTPDPGERGTFTELTRILTVDYSRRGRDAAGVGATGGAERSGRGHPAAGD